MPLKTGRFTVKEKAFVKAMSGPTEPVAAAIAAGYTKPNDAAWRLMNNPIVAEATREDARRFALDKAGSIGVYVLATVALDEKQPAGARVSAADKLTKLSGIGVSEADGGKEPHEMDANELHSHRARLEAQRQAIDKALADKATLIIEPETGAFE